MKERLQQILDRLLVESRGSGEISLDDLARAIDVEPVTTSDIAWLLDALEDRLRVVVSPESTAGTDLRRVVPAARTLQTKLGRTPNADEIAADTGLAPTNVRAALLLARVLGRS